MEKITIKSILKEMHDVVENKETKSPSWWLDRGLHLASLWQDLKDEVTKYRMLYKSEIVDLIESGTKKTDAEMNVEAKSENYKMYCYLKGRDEIIGEFIKLAKKRAQIETYYE